MHFNKSIIAGATALLMITSGAFAQVKKKPAAATARKPAAATHTQQAKPELLPVDPNVIIGKLPNGFTYYIRANSEPKNRAFVYLVDKAGSLQETDAQQGLAHFTEHMAFNGTRDFPKNDLISYLQRSGVKFGADVNASTSFDQTVYQLALPTDSAKVFERGFNIMANIAGFVTFDQKEIDSERGVVLEEARQNGKDAQERLQKQTLPVILNNSRYAERLPIGKEDIIKTFNQAAIKSFYHDWYRPDLQAIIVVGDFDPRRVLQLIKDNFLQFTNPVPEKPRLDYAALPTPGTVVKFATDKEFPYTLAQIIVKHPQTTVKTKADFFRDVRVNLFNQMLNARISELSQQRLPKLLFGQTTYGSFTGRQDAFTSIAVANNNGLEAALKVVVGETDRAKKFGFTLTELERAKQNALVGVENAYKERDKTNSASFISQYLQNFVNGEAIPGIEYEYNFYVENIGKITLAEMNAMATKFISDQNRVIIVEAPDAQKANLPDEKKLLTWIAEADKDLTAYSDDVNTTPLLASLPPGSKIVKKEEDTLLNSTRLTLANGVKVILMPTKFKNDQILVNGYSFGGTSLASDADFPSANLAGSVVSSSGVGSFTQVQLDKKLSGKQVTMSPYVSEYSQGVSGSSSAVDFDTAMQLLYLYFTQPRKDNDIWQSTISQTKSLLANRGADPGSVYADTVTAVLNNYNKRAMVTTVDQLNSASLDKAYDFYKARFADAAGFTFTFVGNFTNEQIIPYIERYLGALPADNHKETYKNLGIHPQAGQITKTVYKGIGDKSAVQLVFSGPYDYNEANNIQLDALEEILNIRLLDRLREKESGAYSPDAGLSYIKIPEGRYKATISFSCAPANVDKLVADVMDEVNKLKQNGADPKDIEKFVAGNARSIQLQLRQNIFWVGFLASSDQNQENPDRILQHIQNLNNVTVQSTKDAANKYLSGTNLIKLILMPEKK
jgi:zinc protease